MFEKVNPSHPDKVADRIAGALVDLAYRQEENPRIAVEVLIGHERCYIITETNVHLRYLDVCEIVNRITGAEPTRIKYHEVPQDKHLAENQVDEVRCGDNGIFKGVPVSEREKRLSQLMRKIYKKYPTDGKAIVGSGTYVYGDEYYICQSCANAEELLEYVYDEVRAVDVVMTINPLGDWTGGIDVDTGATNRKLGSDMGRAVTGGGLHGKDLSKADVSVNIYAHVKAQESGEEVNLQCAIGDTEVDGKPYAEIVDVARKYIASLGGFEKLAEWGLI